MPISKKLNIWNQYFKKKDQSFLFVLVLIGMGIRLITVFKTQIWLDEASIFFSATENNPIALLTQNHWDTCHPPFYFLFLHYWSKLGYGPVFLRIPSLIVSFFILYLVPVVAKKIDVHSKTFPFISLFLFSFSHPQVSLNIVARPYPFVILLSLISLIIFFDLSKPEKKIHFKKTVLFALINFLIFFVDYSGVWLLMSYLGYLLIIFFSKQIKSNTNLLIGIILSAGLCLIMVPSLIHNLPNSLARESYLAPFFSGNPIIKNLPQLNLFTGIVDEGHPIFRDLFNNGNISAAIIIVVLSFLLLRVNREKLFLFILCLLPVLLSFCFSIIYAPIFLNRNLLIVNVGIIFSLALLFSKIMKKEFLIIIGILVLGYFMYFFPGLYYVSAPHNWSKLVREMNKKEQKTKYLITYDYSWYYLYPINYYSLVYNKEKPVIISFINKKEGEKLSILKNNKKNTVFFIDTNKENRELYYKLAKKNCSIREIFIDKYLFFSECQY